MFTEHLQWTKHRGDEANVVSVLTKLIVCQVRQAIKEVLSGVCVEREREIELERTREQESKRERL